MILEQWLCRHPLRILACKSGSLWGQLQVLVVWVHRTANYHGWGNMFREKAPTYPIKCWTNTIKIALILTHLRWNFRNLTGKTTLGGAFRSFFATRKTCSPPSDVPGDVPGATIQLRSRRGRSRRGVNQQINIITSFTYLSTAAPRVHGCGQHWKHTFRRPPARCLWFARRSREMSKVWSSETIVQQVRRHRPKTS